MSTAELLPPTETDECLLQAIGEGDEQAFGDLVNRYEAKLRRLITGLLGDASEAEDIAQETFLKVLKSAQQFRGEGSARAWLFRIATHTALDRLRLLKRRPELPLEAIPEPSAGGTADEKWAELKRIERLWQGLSRLNPDYRTALVLREIEGLNYREIGEIVEASVGTVLSRVHRAREQLAQLLEE